MARAGFRKKTPSALTPAAKAVREVLERGGEYSLTELARAAGLKNASAAQGAIIRLNEAGVLTQEWCERHSIFKW